MDLPVRFVTASTQLLATWKGAQPTTPVLELTRHMTPPWIESAKHGSEVFKN